MMWRRKGDRSSQQGAGDDAGKGLVQSGEGSLSSQEAHPKSALLERSMLEARNVDRPIGYSSEVSTAYFRSPQAAVSAQRSYAVPRGYKISASIFCARPVAVYGELEGRELVAGVVTVMPGGVLRGQSRIGTLLAAGLVDGHVQASKSVEVSNQGEITGEVRAPSIDVHPGARLRGASLQVGSR